MSTQDSEPFSLAHPGPAADSGDAARPSRQHQARRWQQSRQQARHRWADLARCDGNCLRQVERLYDQVSDAIKQDRPVTLETRRERSADGAQDGLDDNHVYIVDKIYKDINGDVRLKLRNPWNTNANVGEGRDTKEATISVKLETLVKTRGLQYFHIGPER